MPPPPCDYQIHCFNQGRVLGIGWVCHRHNFVGSDVNGVSDAGHDVLILSTFFLRWHFIGVESTMLLTECGALLNIFSAVKVGNFRVRSNSWRVKLFGGNLSTGDNVACGASGTCRYFNRHAGTVEMTAPSTVIPVFYNCVNSILPLYELRQLPSPS
ncbi:hypothetical protein CHS0354_006028 [Potamilus streckersoni]|uniref:Uncharacterized protein n=1 Tax=Potamilus streckersoni TaxID=2493646 RepID=A0AAE0S309_9BIVA|nr:hypothetical protein CHS0354_006028 [Potamilus streckersoni]